MQIEEERAGASSNEALLNFEAWARKWVPLLWAWVHYRSLGSEEFREDFLEAMAGCRSKVERLLKRSEGELPAVGVFVKEWIRRQQRLSDVDSKEERDWEELALLVFIFKYRLPPTVVAQILGLPMSSLKYRTYQALRSFSEEAQIEWKTQSRDCARFDLFAVDILLKETWNDPLGIFDPARLGRHFLKCKRCEKIHKNFEHTIHEVGSRRLHPVPDDALEWMLAETRSRSRVLSLGWFANWPWYVKTPVQMGLLTALVIVAVIVPSFGEIFPNYERVGGDVASKIGDLPWRRFIDLEMITSKLSAMTEFAQDEEKDEGQEELVAAAETDSAEDDSTAQDESASSEDSKTLVAKSEISQDLKTDEQESASQSKKQVVKVSKSANKENASEDASDEKPTTVAKATPQKEEKKDSPQSVPLGVGEKLFFRWGAFSPDLDASAQTVLKLLQKFNAVPEGELELGASYLGGRYYHFSINRSDYSKLLNDIKTLNLHDFTNSKATSKRTTPADRRRIVFLIRSQD